MLSDIYSGIHRIEGESTIEPDHEKQFGVKKRSEEHMN